MLSKKLGLAFALVFVVGCVSAHKENVSVQKGATQDGQVKVSVEQNEEMSTSNFVVLEFTIENTGDDYKRYKSIDLVLPEKLKKDVRVVVGQDLVNWSEGIKNKTELERYNRAMVLSSITAVAGASAALSNDAQYQKIAGGIAVAGAGTMAVDDFMRIRNSIADLSVFHLFGQVSHVILYLVSHVDRIRHCYFWRCPATGHLSHPARRIYHVVPAIFPVVFARSTLISISS